MAETDAENRNLPGEALDQRHRDAGFTRRARPRGDHDLSRLPGGDLLERQRVVAMNVHVRTELAQILDEVVGEAVVVVDQQEHGSMIPMIVAADAHSSVSSPA